MSNPRRMLQMKPFARNSYGRLIAFLAAGSGDVAGAENALGDAFVKALERWPVDGIPQKPEAWLLRRPSQTRSARLREVSPANRRGSADRRGKPRTFARRAAETSFRLRASGDRCCRRTPLMLQTVLSVDAARIASALLVSPAAMGQRLIRDKKQNPRTVGQSAEDRDVQFRKKKILRLDKPTSWS
jgi:RNA polymerase sigma-70 factor (ECF subfamily)